MPAAKVLIVDDDEVVRTLINLLLRAHGYDTCYAADGYHARSPSRGRSSRTPSFSTTAFPAATRSS